MQSSTAMDLFKWWVHNMWTILSSTIEHFIKQWTTSLLERSKMYQRNRQLDICYIWLLHSIKVTINCLCEAQNVGWAPGFASTREQDWCIPSLYDCSGHMSLIHAINLQSTNYYSVSLTGLSPYPVISLLHSVQTHSVLISVVISKVYV